MWNARKENLLQKYQRQRGTIETTVIGMRLGSQPLSEHLKSFKMMLDGMAAMHKHLLDDNKVIYLSRGLGEKYNILVTSMPSKPHFPSYSQFVIALQSYDLHLQSITFAP